MREAARKVKGLAADTIFNAKAQRRKGAEK